jgi:hypothetical protein
MSSTNNQTSKDFPLTLPSPLKGEGEERGVLVIWKLEFEICLEFGICNFEFNSIEPISTVPP